MSAPSNAVSALAARFAAGKAPGRPISPGLDPAVAALAARFGNPRPKAKPTALAKLFRHCFGQEFGDRYFADGLTFEAACKLHREKGRQIRHPVAMRCGSSALGEFARHLAGQ